ncbi:MAG: hypothetical protein HUJ26_22240 [Planctomycetaceae bacterium]|nr:hypothetical protein [Planctomycetaceae bacterium]
MRQRFSSTLAILAVLIATTSNTAHAAISVGTLTQEQAREKYGITMHARNNGDAGIKVWLEFKQEGWLEKFTYAELRMKDSQGRHLLSAKLQPNAVHHRQAPGVTTVYFSATPEQLKHCSFLVVCYGSNEGDVGYYLNVMDFLDMEDPVTEK